MAPILDARQRCPGRLGLTTDYKQVSSSMLFQRRSGSSNSLLLEARPGGLCTSADNAGQHAIGICVSEDEGAPHRVE
eukprot:4609899-Amphidinium_carterae.2